jgi:HSP20 family protein
MTQSLTKTQDAHAAQIGQPYQQEGQLRYPPVDISECESEFVIEADMPGVKEENIDIQFHQGELTISGKIEVPQRPDDHYRFRQFGSTDFYRAFRIGESVESANISAHCTDGVLTVHLPKAEKLKPRKIDVARK